MLRIKRDELHDKSKNKEKLKLKFCFQMGILPTNCEEKTKNE